MATARLLLLFMMTACAATVLAAGQSYTFGVVPQQSAAKTARQWVPLLQRLSASSGVKLVLKSARDIPTFQQELANGGYDIAYVNPHQYVVSQRRPGYRAIA